MTFAFRQMEAIHHKCCLFYELASLAIPEYDLREAGLYAGKPVASVFEAKT